MKFFKKIVIIAFLFLGSFKHVAFAQHSPSKSQLIQNEMQRYQQIANQPEGLLFNGDNYDVKYYRLDIRLNPDTTVKYVKGNVTTYFTTTQTNVTDIVFDLASPVTYTSVNYHGSNLAAAKINKTGDNLTITLPNIPVSGTLDSVTVFYEGVPPIVPFFGNGTGFVKSTHNGGANNYIYTLSEPFSAYTWWPCKSMVANDKADSMDIIVSHPSGFKAAANGALISVTGSGSNMRTAWKVRSPISSYQVCVAVANYDQYPTTPAMVNIGGTMMPFFNYIFPESNTATAKTVLDRTKLMLTTFSTYLGDYPFKNEKYGHYSFGFSGGMEHNTFSGMNPGTYNSTADWSVIAHELGHQWFGANVTCGSWKDIWVNESFAQYSEVLCAEFAPSVTNGATGYSVRTAAKNLTMSSSNQAKSIYANDTTDMNAIFTPAVYIYERGAMFISMLRKLLGDANFFQAIKNYQSDPLLKGGNAYTNDVKRHMEAVSGYDLTEMFNDWIYNTGVARYNSAKWNTSGNDVILYLPQTTQYTTNTHFNMPVVVKMSRTSPAKDTTVILYDNNGILNYINDGVLTSSGTNTVQYRLSFIPTTVTFDPENETIATGTFTKDAGMVLVATNAVTLNGIKEANSSKLNYSVEQGMDYASINLERSADNVNFVTINSISSSAQIQETQFNYTDNNIANDIIYYRVKVILKNGATLYSKILALKAVLPAGYYSISPNPAKSFINITAAGASENVNIIIYTGEGKVVQKLEHQRIGDNKPVIIPAKGFAAGNYFIDIIRVTTDQKITKRLILLP